MPTYFGLSSGGEEVWFENSSGTIIDDVTFPAMPDTSTFLWKTTRWQCNLADIKYQNARKFKSAII